MLVSNVARLFRIPQPNPTAECDGSPAQTLEAGAVLDQLQEATATTTATTTLAAPHGDSKEGLILRTIAQSAIVDSKGEAGLTGVDAQQQQQQDSNLSPLVPTKVGTQG